MKNSIFRQKSLDKLSSTEQLNEYIKVENPSVFLALGAILILLIGTCIWGIFGSIEAKADIAVVVEEGTMTIYSVEEIEVGQDAVVEGVDSKIKEVENMPISVEDADGYAMHLLELDTSEYVYVGSADTTLEDGSYSGIVILESIHPMYFVTN